jgi:peptidoglycan/xylan/chitin deacetylase (PgdA/CDA1 family)
LRSAAHIPDGTYDCFILTQTLHVVADMAAVLREAHRILKPGGVLLATLPAASRVCVEYGREGDFWRATEAGARELFRGVFPAEDIEVNPYGNLLTTVAFLHGLARHELSPEEFAPCDPWYPLLFGVRAIKSQQDAPRVTVSDRPGRGVVLLYHRVAAAGLDPHGLALAPEVFQAQMHEIGSRYQPLPLAELARAAARRELPPGAVAVTFDDAYEDSLTTASPILMAHRVPATFFAVGASSERPEPFWWDLLAEALLTEVTTPVRLVLTVGDRGFDLPTVDSAQRRSAHDRLYAELVRAGAAARREFMAALRAWAPPPAPLPMPLAEGGLRLLADRPGHELGAHGWDHLALSHRPAAERRADVTRAKAALERALGLPVSAFSYPYGDTSAEAARDVRAAGYSLAVACEPESVSAASDPWRLPRIEIGPRNADRFGEILRAALGLD